MAIAMVSGALPPAWESINSARMAAGKPHLIEPPHAGPVTDGSLVHPEQD